MADMTVAVALCVGLLTQDSFGNGRRSLMIVTVPQQVRTVLISDTVRCGPATLFPCKCTYSVNDSMAVVGLTGVKRPSSRH